MIDVPPLIDALQVILTKALLLNSTGKVRVIVWVEESLEVA